MSTRIPTLVVVVEAPPEDRFLWLVRAVEFTEELEARLERLPAWDAARFLDGIAIFKEEIQAAIRFSDQAPTPTDQPELVSTSLRRAFQRAERQGLQIRYIPPIIILKNGGRESATHRPEAAVESRRPSRKVGLPIPSRAILSKKARPR